MYNLWGNFLNKYLVPGCQPAGYYVALKQVVLGFTGQQGKQATESKSKSSISPQALLHLLPLVSHCVPALTSLHDGR